MERTSRRRHKPEVTVVLASKEKVRGAITVLEIQSLQTNVAGSSETIPRQVIVQIHVLRIKGPSLAIGAAGIGTVAVIG